MKLTNNNEKPVKHNNMQSKINLDYDWNTEYGDGDIPDIDKNVATTSTKNTSKNTQTK